MAWCVQTGVAQARMEPVSRAAMVADAAGGVVGRLDARAGVFEVGLDDGDDAGGVDGDGGAADAVAGVGDLDGQALGSVGGLVDVVDALDGEGDPVVNLEDDLPGLLGEDDGVANGGGGDEVALWGDSGDLDDGEVDGVEGAGAELLDGLAEVLVDEHDVAGVDPAAECGVDLEGEAAGEDAGLGEELVGIVAERGAADEGDFERGGGGAAGELVEDLLGVAGAGEAADADGHSILDVVRSRFG
jgi:hypothetical protein